MAIGGYTTAIMSRDHDTNLVVTMLARLRDLLRRRPALRTAGAAALGRLPRARDVRPRGLDPVAAAAVVDLPRRQRRRQRRADGDPQQPLGLRRRLDVLGDPLRARVADPARPRRARLPRGARQRDRRRRVGSRAARLQDARLRDLGRVRRSGRFAVRPRSERVRPAERVRHLPLARRSWSARPSPGSARSGESSSALRSSGSCRRSRRASPLIGAEHGRDVVFGAAVIVIMLLLPDGFAGLLARLSRERRRRQASAPGLNRGSISIKLPRSRLTRSTIEIGGASMPFNRTKLGAVLVGLLATAAAAGTAAASHKSSTPGVTSKQITIGGTFPYTGPASLYKTIPSAEQAFFAYVNAKYHGGPRPQDQGHRPRRRYNPAQTVPDVKQLVEQDHVFAIVGSLGTAPGLVDVGLPQPAQGAAGAARHRRRVLGQLRPSRLPGHDEAVDDGLAAGLPGRGQALREVHPRAQAEREDRRPLPERRLRQELPRRVQEGPRHPHGRASSTRSRTASPTRSRSIGAHVGQIAEHGANVLVIFATPSASIAALATARQVPNWHPLTILNNVSANRIFMRSPGSSYGATVNGVISTTYIKSQTAQPNLPAMKLAKKIIHTYAPALDASVRVGDSNLVYGLAVALDVLSTRSSTRARTRRARASCTRFATSTTGRTTRSSIREWSSRRPRRAPSRWSSCTSMKWAGRQLRRLEDVRQACSTAGTEPLPSVDLRGGASAPPRRF